MKSEDIILTEMEKQNLQTPEEPGVKSGSSKFMISGEAPLVVGKACELLVREISSRAWQHTERNRRRTLQRQDIHAAVGESEVFDFLIDIVPRVTTARAPAANLGDAQEFRMPQGQPMAPPMAQGIPTQMAPPADMLTTQVAAPPPLTDNGTGIPGNEFNFGYSFSQPEQQQAEQHQQVAQAADVLHATHQDPSQANHATAWDPNVLPSLPP